MLTRFSLFPEQASTVAPRVDALLYFLLAITVFFVALIAGLILYFMVKYRRRGEAHPPVVHGSLALEAAWTIIPFGLTMIIFFWGASIYASLRRPPDDALQVDVVAKQWMWKLQHLEGRREIDELHIPVGRPVKLVMTSEDVIHSFYVPAFRTKQDVVPGRYTTMWFEATRPGTYHLFCAEYCGTLHAGMIGWVIAMEPAAFQAWLAGTGPGAAAPAPATGGEVLFQQLGCVTCHRPDAKGLGPPLVGLFGSSVRLQDGRTVVADENYLRESILTPQAKITAGYQPVMPTFQGLIHEEDVMQLIAYIKSLKAESSGRP
jgi:cytochrome c oxidase subunit 2